MEVKSAASRRSSNRANITKHSVSLLAEGEKKKKSGIAHFAHSNNEAHFVSVSATAVVAATASVGIFVLL